MPAVLQGMQTKGYEIRRLGHAPNAENTALFVQFVIIKRKGGQVVVSVHIGKGSLGLLQLPAL